MLLSTSEVLPACAASVVDEHRIAGDLCKLLGCERKDYLGSLPGTWIVAKVEFSEPRRSVAFHPAQKLTIAGQFNFNTVRTGSDWTDRIDLILLASFPLFTVSMVYQRWAAAMACVSGCQQPIEFES
jgi:hypothetical protein